MLESQQRAAQQELDEASAAFGLIIEQQEEQEDIFYLWPEHVRVFKFWLQIQTQWQRAGMDGMYVGLNYAGVQVAMQHLVPKALHQKMFQQIQVMEKAFLQAIREQHG